MAPAQNTIQLPRLPTALWVMSRVTWSGYWLVKVRLACFLWLLPGFCNYRGEGARGKGFPSKELNPVSAQTQIVTPTLQQSSQGSQAQDKHFTGGTANISPSMTDH